MHRRRMTAIACLAALLAPAMAPTDAKPERSRSRSDLAVTSVQRIPQQAAAGARFAARVVVTNKGSARAGATPVQVMLSRDARASADDPVAGRTRVPPLPSRARTARTIAVQVPAAATGRYRVVVCLTPKKPPRSKAERRNDCEIGPLLSVPAELPPPPEPPWSTAQLTGDIALRRAGHTDDGTRDHTWDRWGDIRLSFTVAAPPGEPAKADFTDAGSSYTWSGAETVKEGGDQCTFWQQELEEGKGPLAGRATARFVEGTGQQTIEVSLAMPYLVNGTSGADCREDHTWAEHRVDTTTLRFDLAGTGDDDVSHYVASVTPPAGSTWDTVSAALDLRFQRRSL